MGEVGYGLSLLLQYFFLFLQVVFSDTLHLPPVQKTHSLLILCKISGISALKLFCVIKISISPYHIFWIYFHFNSCTCTKLAGIHSVLKALHCLLTFLLCVPPFDRALGFLSFRGKPLWHWTATIQYHIYMYKYICSTMVNTGL